MTQNPLLFLDFDGVLHASLCPSPYRFMHLPRFQRVMHEHPEVDIVLTSAGEQDAYSAKLVRALFTPAIQVRVIGRTLGADAGDEEEMRYRQILKFMRQGRRVVPWVALDDAEEEFPRNCPQLVLCDPVKGFDEEAETRLRLKLLAIRRHATAA